MKRAVVEILALIAVVALVAAHFAGVILPENAFFIALALFVLYTGYQLINREGMNVGAAVTAMLFQPSSYRTKALGYGVYMVTVVASLTVLFQAVSAV